MFTVTFFLGGSLPPVVLMFKGQDTLDKAINEIEAVDRMALSGGTVIQRSISDDFGQRLTLVGPIIGMLVQDMKLAQQADIERGINQLLTQIAADARASAMPEIARARQQANRGPAVMSPFPANGRGF